MSHKDGSRLHWREIFTFLYDCFQTNPHAAYVGFYLGYDFTQWLRSFPENRARMLLTKEGIAVRRRTKSGRNNTPFPVYIDDWEMDMLGDRRMKLRPHVGGKNTLPWMYVNDAGPFYQTSFLVAVDPASWLNPIVSEEEHLILARGKGGRAKAKLDANMIEYNTLENLVLARLMHQLNEGLHGMGVRLKRDQWFGPGQAAGAWLDSIDAPIGDEIRATVPYGALDAARQSYFGGWFEDFVHGYVPGESYEYDINSAYPFIIAQLPCLLHGEWKHGTGNPGPSKTGQYRLVYATVRGNDSVCGAMLHRTKDARVYRPDLTIGWFWQHELDAARRVGVVKTVRVKEWWSYDPCSCPPPLAPIADLYALRLQVGKKSPSGRAYRIVYNSAYGKTAQSVGRPKYANPVYASLITAGCRTMILEAIASHPAKTRHLLKVATDGVCFKTPHPSLVLDPEKLGAWSEHVFRNLTVALPGIYWDDETRRRVRAGESPKLKSRGINARDLANVIGEIDRQFDELSDDNWKWPVASIPVTFSMITAKQALARGKWNLAGVVETGTIREIDCSPRTKRATVFCTYDEFGLLRSEPFVNDRRIPSVPYEERFGEELREEQASYGVTPDGTIWDVMKNAIQ